MIRVTVWNENFHEREIAKIREVYPNGIHGQIASFLEKQDNMIVKTATMDQVGQGLSKELLDRTDVLIWWAHVKHDDLTDENAAMVADYVRKGMGFIALHSAHMCKPLSLLLGTTMTLNWRDDDHETLFVTCPTHPIAKGIPLKFDLPDEEMYGEYFDIPKPDDVVFTGWFKGGYVFRSGVTFTRGRGKIFYFQPGHEAYPIYYNENIQKIIINAVNWAMGERTDTLFCNHMIEIEE